MDTSGTAGNSHSEKPTSPRSYALWIIIAVTFAVYAAVVVASFLPNARLWGINHLAFYSPAIRITALVIIGVSFFPFVARRIYKALLGLSRTIKHGGQGVESALTFLAIFSVALFMILRSSTDLLGDGQLVATNFQLARDGDEQIVTRSIEAIIAEDHIAPGTTILYYGAEKFVGGVLNRAPVFGIRLFNCVLGAAFLYIFFGLLRKSSFSKEIRLWLLILTLFASSMQLFFGYVENYTPLVFLLFLYVVSSMPILHGRGRLWIPIVLFALSVFMHVQAVLFAPSLVFLILHRFGGRLQTATEKYAAPVLMLLMIVGTALIGVFTGARTHFLPLVGNEETYGVFSTAHLWDVLNEIVLLMPILPALLVMVWVSRKHPHKNSSGQAVEWFSLASEWRFIFLILACCLVYLVLFKSEIGMGRDWDLFSMASVGLIPLAVLALNRFHRSIKDQIGAAVVVVPAVLVTMVLGSAWVGINASSSRSVDRFESMLTYDRTHAPYAYENLAIFHYTNGDLPRTIENMKRATDVSKNPRQYVMLALYRYENGEVEGALQLLRDVLRGRPEYKNARLHLATILEKEKMLEELNDVADTGTKQHPHEAEFWFHLGETSLLLGNTDEGLAALRRCKALNPSPERLARINELIGRFSSTRQ